ncbi:hypothetical protein BHE74_00040453 [Ensete ventricosum]|uniref:Uncharacterized protein n=1 Tax=Ensete ventricosum TaxID=4639 RepID=A0A444C3G3_ENSVE|nr:hypothetical protein B296_00015813 [Ensete ventricosum]RWV80483.1 hypothetical protein GW17_00058243 [Ensete ventricosum]RWW53088.1 hypothetical protein BHE74_00040453 [Ensete ventricosum]
MRLPGDSGRFGRSEIEFFSSSSSPYAASAPASAASQQSLILRSASRRVA